MTTQDHPAVTDSDQESQPAVAEAPQASDRTESFAPAEPSAPADAPSPAVDEESNRSQVASAGRSTGGTADESSTEQMLFADADLADLRARWAGVQAAFVDDPKDCVQKADALVSDLVDQLTKGFAGARARLEEQWARGEQASTEDLRLALMHYREFFERLLAV
ncbi:hypothetical protein [Mycobacterium colombiense]|uniref:Uncharacterized protein n=1 Tax=Mycobacterium colombiense TaxID=339268 RepID=A0A853LWG0_9MYCO|nr:hypothetical protein [Mycobacterium colombiense]OBJ12350.1 hypothetical protein A5623_24565 [Mycobacterium colombiense]OBJ58610.1 hypothetical protein A5628_13545 [Mycobacterium colombiense]